jgi:hypothetical protein
MSQPANRLPSQAGLDDNSAPNPLANFLLPPGTILPDPLAPRRSSQERSAYNSDSQATSSSSDESNRLFSPPMTDAADAHPGSGQGSSQESQLQQLSLLAAAQDKLPGHLSPARSAVKRTADGTVKDPPFVPMTSPARTAGHSRNTSAVSAVSAVSAASAASAASAGSASSSNVTEASCALAMPSRRFRPCRVLVEVDTDASRSQLSSELKTRLSYALLKVHHGWEFQDINQVETLVSGGPSPTSSNSTIPGAPRASDSPRIQASHGPAPLTPRPVLLPNPCPEHASRGAATTPASQSANPGVLDMPSLAPPLAIQPLHGEGSPRRNPNPKHPPIFPPPQPQLRPLPQPQPLLKPKPQLLPLPQPQLLPKPQPHHTSPRTPTLPTMGLLPSPGRLHGGADPMVVSPAHNNREKDAMEALLFMSSPGNSAGLQQLPMPAQPLERVRNGASAALPSTRTALPTSAPKRKSLPNGRPTHSSQPLPSAHSPKKRVGFGKSRSTLSDMDVDEPASPRRHGGYARAPVHPWRPHSRSTEMLPPQPRFAVPLASASGKPTPPKPGIRSLDDLDAMLDRVAAEASSSESDHEIELSTSPKRRKGSAELRG